MAIPTLLPVESWRYLVRWRTDVQSSRYGTEIRASTLAQPRAHISATYQLTDAQHRALYTSLALTPDASAMVALPHEGTPALASITTTTAVVDAAYCDWIAAGRAVLVVGVNASYTTTISSFSGGTLTLAAAPSSGSYPAGVTMLYPCETVLIEDGQRVDRRSVSVSRWSLSGRQSSPIATWGSGGTVTVFRGAPVIVDRPLGDGGESYSLGAEWNDAGGAVTVTSERNRGARARSGSWLIRTPAQRQNWKALLYWQRGRWKNVWSPTWRADYDIHTQPSGGSSTIRLVNDFTLAPGALQLEYADGSVSYHHVASMASGGAYQQLDLVPAIAASIPGGSVRTVSRLELCRLDADDIVIEYRGDWVGRVTLPLVALDETNDMEWPDTAAEVRLAFGGRGTWASAWKLDEASGSALDVIGGISLAPSNSPTYGNAGPLGGSDLAVGVTTTAQFQHGTSTVYDVGSSTSIALYCAVKFTGASANAFFLGKHSGGSFYYLIGMANTSGHLYAAINDGGGSAVTATIAVNHSDSAWHDVLMVFDRASNTLTIATDLGVATASIEGRGSLSNSAGIHLGLNGAGKSCLIAFAAVATGGVGELAAAPASAIAAIRAYTGR